VSTSQKLIIDGYNVVFTDDALRRIAITDRRSARAQLIDRVKAYLTLRRIQTTIVFDGRGRMVDHETIIPGRLQVVYSAEGQTADDFIIETVKASQVASAYLVVSSDAGHVARPARALGCQVMGSKAFLERLASAQGKDAPPPTASTETDLGDTDYWLERFREEPYEKDE